MSITRLVECETHDYMDMYPNKDIHAFRGEDINVLTEKAVRWAISMNKNYSGGTTTFKRVYSQMESIQFLSKKIADTLSVSDEDWSEGNMVFLKELSSILEEVVKA